MRDSWIAAEMRFLSANGVNLHFADEGAPSGRPIVFANSLGTDFRLWDDVVTLLPHGFRIIRFDKRGHGLSSCPPYPYSMRDLAADAAGLLDSLGVKGCLFVGLSIGGLIAQSLMLERPDLVRAAVLSNTAVKIGDRAMWQSRIGMARANRLEEIAPDIIKRWLAQSFRERRPEETAGWRTMLCRTPGEGYAGCSHAIMETDFTGRAHEYGCPVWAVAGSEDGATPPGLVRDTADRIPGCRRHEFKGAGHLPCVEMPHDYAALLRRVADEVFAS